MKTNFFFMSIFDSTDIAISFFLGQKTEKETEKIVSVLKKLRKEGITFNRSYRKTAELLSLIMRAIVGFLLLSVAEEFEMQFEKGLVTVILDSLLSQLTKRLKIKKQELENVIVQKIKNTTTVSLDCLKK